MGVTNGGNRPLRRPEAALEECASSAAFLFIRLQNCGKIQVEGYILGRWTG